MTSNNQKLKMAKKARRHGRVRAVITGTAARPRLCVSRSLIHISAQLIDDTTGKTLVALSDKGLKGSKTERAIELGKLFAAIAVSAKMKLVVFDRSSFKYHGRVKAFAEAAREGGLEF